MVNLTFRGLLVHMMLYSPFIESVIWPKDASFELSIKIIGNSGLFSHNKVAKMPTTKMSTKEVKSVHSYLSKHYMSWPVIMNILDTMETARGTPCKWWFDEIADAKTPSWYPALTETLLSSSFKFDTDKHNGNEIRRKNTLTVTVIKLLWWPGPEPQSGDKG